MTIPHSQLIILMYVLGFVLLVFVSIVVTLVKLFSFVVKQLKEETEKNRKEIEILIGKRQF